MADDLQTSTGGLTYEAHTRPSADFGVFAIRIVALVLVVWAIVSSVQQAVWAVQEALFLATSGYTGMELIFYATNGLVGVGLGVLLLLAAPSLARILSMNVPWPSGVTLYPAAVLLIALLGLTWLVAGMKPLLLSFISWLVNDLLSQAGEFDYVDPLYSYGYGYGTPTWFVVIDGGTQVVLGIMLIFMSRQIAGWLGFPGAPNTAPTGDQ